MNTRHQTIVFQDAYYQHQTHILLSHRKVIRSSMISLQILFYCLLIHLELHFRTISIYFNAISHYIQQYIKNQPLSILKLRARNLHVKALHKIKV